MSDKGANQAAGIMPEGVYRVSIQAVCLTATRAGRILGAALKEANAETLDIQQHVVFDTAHPAVKSK